MAVRAPFSRAAEGARLPDGNPNLSATLALTQKYALTANADGELDVTVLPNLYCHSFTTRGSIVAATDLALGSATTTLDGRQVAVTQTGKTGLGFDVTTLNGQYTRYRVVSYAARLRATAGVSATGEFTTAVLPLKGLTPMLNSLLPGVSGADGSTVGSNSYWSGCGPRANLSNVIASLGLPYTGSGNTAVVDFTKYTNTPCHAVASAAQVAQRGMHVRGLPFEAAARDYINTTYSAHGTDSLDVAFYMGSGAAGLVSSGMQQLGVDMSFARVGGHESLSIGGAGFLPSTTVGTVEVIYHVEAVTNPQYAVLARPTGQVPKVANNQTLDQVLTTLHRIPRISFADVVQTAGDAMLGEIEGQVGHAAAGAASSLAGMLGRLMSAGA